MIMNKSRISPRLNIAIVAACALISSSAYAAEVQVKMLNKGSDGRAMVFEPALVHANPGDTVHFVSVDKGHNVESIAGMIPDGAEAFKASLSQDLSVKVTKPGVYGYRCVPHYGMGMLGLIVVGKPVNEDAAKAVTNSGMPSFAKNKFTKLFGDLDAKK